MKELSLLPFTQNNPKTKIIARITGHIFGDGWFSYNTEKKELNIIQKEFFTYLPEHQEQKKIILKNTEQLLNQAIEKRIPNRKFGLLFSGGIDSTFLAKHFKDNNYDFTCYTAVLDTENIVPKDLGYAQKAAQELGLKLKIKKIKQEL